MKRIFFAVCMVAYLHGLPQKTIDVDKTNASGLAPNFFMMVNGEPFVMAKFSRLVEGSPYFENRWMKSTIVTNGQGAYPDALVKLNLLENKLHYQDPNGNELVATTTLQKVILFDTSAQRVFTFVNSAFINTETPLTPGWYQLLFEGKTMLFKFIKKTLLETKPYSSATIEQSIANSNSYFILYENRLQQVHKLKNFPEILKDKKDELITYLNKHKLNGKNDEDFIAIIAYYDSLK